MTLEVIAYNEIADLCYKKYGVNGMVMINGEITGNNINIKEIEKIE